MDSFIYQDGSLYCEDVPIEWIAAQAGTPTYIYSAHTFADHYRKLQTAFQAVKPLICFAVKSCSNIAIIRLLADLGAGMDVVSGGELFRAKTVGVAGSKIVFAGVGKNSQEIRDALLYSSKSATKGGGIRLFNIESEAEFENIESIARSLNITCNASLRINPDVDPHTHKYTTTGITETKFGIDIHRAKDFFKKYANKQYCKLNSIHLHIGSPVLTVEPYIKAVTKAVELIDELKTLNIQITGLNIGGGFGADYETGQSPDAAQYAKALLPLITERVKEQGLQIILEPGRSLSANAGILLTRVEYLKRSGNKRFVIVDAGMQTLIRPALYNAFHFIWPVSVAPMHQPTVRTAEPDMPGLETFDVVGPICESADFLAQNRKLPPVTRGQLLAVFGAGAYGAAMSSRYNSTPLPAEVLVDGTAASIIRRRETYEDLLLTECTPRKLETIRDKPKT